MVAGLLLLLCGLGLFKVYMVEGLGKVQTNDQFPHQKEVRD